MFVIGYGLIALAVMVMAEDIIARSKHRRAETGTVLIAGGLGIAFFIGILHTAGVL